MKLTADDLREIATTVDKIKEVRLRVDVVEVRGHKVLLKRTDHQLDGLEYHVIGITDSEFSGEVGKVMRDAAVKPGSSASEIVGARSRGRGGRL